MLSESNPVSFVATVDPIRARAFYEGVLGLTLIADEPVALVFDLNGHMWRIAKTNEIVPANQTVLGWNVRDIAKELQLLSGRGVSFLRFDGMPQDAHGVWTSPSGARVAWFKDSDGNNLSLTECPSDRAIQQPYAALRDP